jgi:hypothetical protein
VLLSRHGRRPVTEVWPVQLNDRLPTVPVPLLPGDPDVTLDLQAAMDGVYDGMAYDLVLKQNYAKELPPGRLPEQDEEWVIRTLIAAGRRPPA